MLGRAALVKPEFPRSSSNQSVLAVGEVATRMGRHTRCCGDTGLGFRRYGQPFQGLCSRLLLQFFSLEHPVIAIAVRRRYRTQTN